jgi:hypothetical protein
MVISNIFGLLNFDRFSLSYRQMKGLFIAMMCLSHRGFDNFRLAPHP